MTSIIVQNENLFLLIDACNEHKWVTYSPFYRVAKQYTLIIDENNPEIKFQWSILSFKKKSVSAMKSKPFYLGNYYEGFLLF